MQRSCVLCDLSKTKSPHPDPVSLPLPHPFPTGWQRPPPPPLELIDDDGAELAAARPIAASVPPSSSSFRRLRATSIYSSRLNDDINQLVNQLGLWICQLASIIHVNLIQFFFVFHTPFDQIMSIHLVFGMVINLYGVNFRMLNSIHWKSSQLQTNRYTKRIICKWFFKNWIASWRRQFVDDAVLPTFQICDGYPPMSFRSVWLSCVQSNSE